MPATRSFAKKVAALRKEVADAASLEEVAALLEEVAALRAHSRFYDPSPRQKVAATTLGRINSTLEIRTHHVELTTTPHCCEAGPSYATLPM